MTSSNAIQPFYQTIEGIPFPGFFNTEIIQTALEFKPQPNDLFIVSYPKCGTTWTQALVYLIATKGKPPEKAPELYKRVPFLEMYGTEAVTRGEETIAIKTHLPYTHAPYSSDAKYIYITRNPKDAVVSLFHHTFTTGYFFEEGTFDDLFDLFLNGKTEYGSFFEHVLSWFAHREDGNVLLLSYEEMKADIRSCVYKIARFMGDNHAEMLDHDPNVLENIVKYSSFNYMKQLFNKQGDDVSGDSLITKEDVDAMPLPPGLKHVRKFVIEHRKPNSKYVYHIREGLVGGWKKVLSEEQARRMDEKVKELFYGTEIYDMWQ